MPAQPQVRLLIAIGLTVSLCLYGCSSTVRQPRLRSPGTAPVQRYNATQFDPYPQNDVGPEIVGGRPIDFQLPPDEVVRARQERPFGPFQAR
ncbi:MAG: hypothetical protein AAGA92_13755 [Planctomycetota bacterium]